jgi:hypothetical protein
MPLDLLNKNRSLLIIRNSEELIFAPKGSRRGEPNLPPLSAVAKIRQTGNYFYHQDLFILMTSLLPSHITLKSKSTIICMVSSGLSIVFFGGHNGNQDKYLARYQAPRGPALLLFLKDEHNLRRSQFLEL